MPPHAGDARPRDTPLELTTPVEKLPGVGPKRARALRRLDIRALAHLINHIPFRYERHAAETNIDQLPIGETITARGQVTAMRTAGGHGKRRRTEAVLHDGHGRLDLVWFNAPWLADRLKVGMTIRVRGKSALYASNPRLTNPKWEPIDDDDAPEPAQQRLMPVYPASEDLPSTQIAAIIDAVLDQTLPLLEDHLPDDYRRERALPTLADTYRMLHRPGDEPEAQEAQRRLIFDELLMLQLGVHMKRAWTRRTLSAPALRWSKAIDQHIRQRLPFTLTEAQDAVIAEIAADLQRDTPANRLIQGDVGSGKTVVALYAMLMGVASERQAALMAPTEVLAEQHFASISAMLEGSRVRLQLLTGSLAEPDKAAAHAAIEAGEIDIIIGTHALITESVRYKSLAVAIIDEQHRFGVHQRARLREKAAGDAPDKQGSPHIIVMTATPIPRTLALTVFGDLDVSTITGLPPGRQPISTRLVTPDQRAGVYDFVRQRLENNDQAYIVVPAIDADQAELQPKADAAEPARKLRTVRELVAELEAGPLAAHRIAGIHARLKRATREQVMGRFRAGLVHALVATTVIEVGVDVPNATVMVIEDAERFGLAQLHQLRGRVGRGTKRSACILISGATTPESQARLEAFVSTSDGFELAEKDLELRGMGEFSGTRQSGVMPFRLAQFPRDLELLRLARRDAGAWIERSPELAAPTERLLKRRLIKAHGEALGLIDIA
ncbi:MAG: ATP-dependent DNA helicase RecG [Phycisphaerales bacterium]